VGAGGEPATAPSVIAVNVSLGDAHRRFAGRPSPWARALDRLAESFGLLFIVSAGNVAESLDIRAFPTMVSFDAATAASRSEAFLAAVSERMAERRLPAPAEAVNG